MAGLNKPNDSDETLVALQIILNYLDVRCRKESAEAVRAGLLGQVISSFSRRERKVADVTFLVSRIFHPGIQTVSPATSTFTHFGDLSNGEPRVAEIKNCSLNVPTR